jgi:hypothetical protein
MEIALHRLQKVKKSVQVIENKGANFVLYTREE